MSLLLFIIPLIIINPFYSNQTHQMVFQRFRSNQLINQFDTVNLEVTQSDSIIRYRAKESRGQFFEYSFEPKKNLYKPVFTDPLLGDVYFKQDHVDQMLDSGISTYYSYKWGNLSSKGNQIQSGRVIYQIDGKRIPKKTRIKLIQ
tara:strand:- start:297 stop:731 length:435 start_codon:yes stop_codon:yes gene_type:complete